MGAVGDDPGAARHRGCTATVFPSDKALRYENGHPTIVTTNRGLADWGEIFGDLDRHMHRAIVFNIRGPSWRLREHHGLEIATTENR